jgi:membrane protein implicated in regulation of membrane protease activity
MHPAVIWFVLGMACFAAETLAPHFVLMFFGIGALAAAGVSLFGHNIIVEMIVFSAGSLISLLLVRSRALGSLWGRARSSSVQNASGVGGPPCQAGRTGIVSRDIPLCGEGEVALGGSYWRAVAAEALPEGAAVRVVGHAPGNEILLRVERLPADARS